MSGPGVSIGSYRPGTLPTAYSPDAAGVERQIWDFPSIAAATQIRIIGSASLAGDLNQLQLVDMAATLAQPADVWVAWWQSNMAMTTQGVAIDMADDDWTDKRLLMFPGSANTAHGTVLGKDHRLARTNANASECCRSFDRRHDQPRRVTGSGFRQGDSTESCGRSEPCHHLCGGIRNGH